MNAEISVTVPVSIDKLTVWPFAIAWVAIGYSAIVPVCCLAGLPIAGWAFKTWQDPAFKAMR